MIDTNFDSILQRVWSWKIHARKCTHMQQNYFSMSVIFNVIHK